jgi:hypothetical protein
MKLLSGIVLLLFSFQAQATIDHWETVVFEYDIWKYMIPSSAVNSNWNTVGYNDASWSSGPGGFGYGDGDDNTTFPNTISCYQRKTFNIVDVNAIDVIVLNIDYDDAFVAYINGVEIARDNITSVGQPAYNQTSDGLREAIVYQGAYPTSFTIDAAFIAAHLVNGTNVLSIQTHNESQWSSDMTSRAYLTLGINDASNNYTPAPPWFIPPIILTDSNLPIVVINTGGVTIPDDPKIDGTMGIINNGPGVRNYLSDPFNEYFGNIGIETRGSSSQSFPKKQWGLETRDNFGNRNDITVFNMAWDNDWVLYAPYSDKSLIRNVLAYDMGWDLGDYAPRTQLCEVILNGQYQGVYVFTEKIKRKDGKVGTDDIEPIDISGNELTGDYVLKVDKTTSGGIVVWNSPYPPYPGASEIVGFQLHDPSYDSLNATQLNYIETYITDFEDALANVNYTDPVLGYRPYIDVNSFINFFLVNEVSKNVDGYRISSFLHKIRTSEGGKLYAGPLWDFNLAFGNANYCQGGNTDGWEVDFYQTCQGGLQNPFWWKRLLDDPYYTHLVSCKWQEMRQGAWHTDSLMARIDTLAAYLDEAQQRNFQKWPIHGVYVWPNNYVGNTYAEDIAYLKQWITDRVNWMDANMYGSCPDLGVSEKELNAIELFPNPGKEHFTFSFNNFISNASLKVFDSSGKLILEQNDISGKGYQIQLKNKQPGLYHYTFNIGGEIQSGKLMIH